jgi:hypothetical protein
VQYGFCVSLVGQAPLIYWLRLFKANELIKRLGDDVRLALGHVFDVSHLAALFTPTPFLWVVPVPGASKMGGKRFPVTMISRARA